MMYGLIKIHQKIHIVDYKSTSQKKKDNGPINLDDKWKATYKRQMDLYVWIMQKKVLMLITLVSFYTAMEIDSLIKIS